LQAAALLTWQHWLVGWCGCGPRWEDCGQAACVGALPPSCTAGGSCSLAAASQLEDSTAATSLAEAGKLTAARAAAHASLQAARGCGLATTSTTACC
jgi:hypothetical protein